MTRRGVAWPAIVLVAAACGKPGPPVAQARGGDIEIRDAFAFAPIMKEAGAAYLTIRNGGSAADTLISVTTPIAAMAGIHDMMGPGGDAMSRLGAVPLAPGATVIFKPGGMHLMLENLSTLPKPGDHFSITLTFSRAGAVTLDLPVRAYNQ